ncbi:MAG TPA: ornithine carbamoyltransferase [Candidatus Saccharimonadales bacterium]|jgi:ornithine carbamoyltransferase|nr:ornithine carbamoyltransferase [Candidatus Saccharimonadales bacterium]
MKAQAPAQGKIESHTLSLSTDLLTGTEWNAAQVQDLFRLAVDVKAYPDRYKTALSGRQLAMIFEKPSLRTRVTFEVGITSLGGTAIYLDHADTHLGDRESVPDVARCLSRWVHGIVGRVFSQKALEILADYASVPVINALSDVYHPCQALCDFFTLEEKLGSARGVKLAYVGDGNNVCHSLMVAGARVGAHVRIATPAGYEPDAKIVAAARVDAAATQGTIELFRAPEEAVSGAQAVYTDVWASMGQEEETEKRAAIFAPYQVNAKLMSQAASGAVFLHCLPAHRGSEVTDDVMESPRSIVFDEAENRLHVQKAILLMLLS